LDGRRVKLVDTAGHREAEGSIEAEGISLGINAALRADLSLRVTDPDSRAITPLNGEILVHNKSDLDGFIDRLSVSALSGKGIDNLRAYILRQANQQIGEGSQIHLSESERSTLTGISSTLKKIVDSADGKLDPVLLAEDLRATIESLGALLGFNISEDALNHIFAQMCIGK